MDRKQLVTIAITAVTSVIAKEVISWLVALAKSTAQTHTAKKKASAMFSKNNLRTLAAVAFVLLTAGSLWLRLLDTSPLTRAGVVWVVVSMVNFGCAVLFLGFNIISRIDDSKERSLKTVRPSASIPALTASGDTADSQPTPDTPTASRQLP